MTVNIFGSYGKLTKSNVDNNYMDSKLILMLKTKLDMNFAQQHFVQKAGDKMTGNLDMGGNRLTNTGTPVDEHDCATRDYLNPRINSLSRTIRSKADHNFVQQNFVTKDYFNLMNKDSKLYAQITSVQDDTDVEKLCKIGDIIAGILTKYSTVQFSYKDQFLSSLTYAISMYSKYKSIFEQSSVEANEAIVSLNGQAGGGIQDLSACTIFVDFKLNIVKIIEDLPKNIFQELKQELNKADISDLPSAEKLFSAPRRGIRKRFRRFLIKRTEEIERLPTGPAFGSRQAGNEGTNEQLQLLLYKNLLLIDIGFVYLMDSLLHNLLM
jgi:hypothetical protein